MRKTLDKREMIMREKMREESHMSKREERGRKLD